MSLVAYKSSYLQSRDLQVRWPALVLATTAISSFMIAFDTTALNVALPSIRQELDISLQSLQWVANAYTLVFASLLLTAGALCDRWGAYRVFVGALVIFALTSAACGLTHGVAALICTRAAQGIGAAALLPSSMALLRDAYPVSQERARALALWGGISATALVMGPVLGGLLVQKLGWRLIFFVNVPICLLAIGAAITAAGRPPRRHRALDFGGQMLAILALLTVTFAITDGRELGWTSPATLVIGAIGAGASAAFLLTERRHREPMLPFALFASRQFSAAVGAGFVYNFAYYGALFVLPLTLQAKGQTPITIGVLMIPMTLATMVFATASGLISKYIRPHILTTIATASGALGAALLLSCGFGTWSMCIGGVLLGTAGMSLPLIVAVALGHVPPERVGIGSGVFNTARQCGGVIGVAVLGSLLRGPLLDADLALASIALAFFLGAVLAFRRLGES